jgi:LacI family transcriptional regulator
MDNTDVISQLNHIFYCVNSQYPVKLCKYLHKGDLYMPTQKSIAQLAGVSIATVSRALADDPRIRPEVKSHIQNIAEKMHYRSNRLIQGMRTGKTGMIGLLIASIELPHYNVIVKGILDEMQINTYQVLIIQTGYEEENIKKALNQLVEQRVDGIIIIGELPILKSSLLEMWSHDISLVCVDRGKSFINTDRVLSDERGMADILIRYLAGLGHRNFTYVGSHMDTGAYNRQFYIEKALQNYHLNLKNITWTLENNDKLLMNIMKSSPQTTAIICFSDTIGAHLIQQANRNKIAIPQQISITGYGNFMIGELITPTLTTMEQNPNIIGETVARLLFKQITEGSHGPDKELDIIHIPGSLIIRESTDKPRDFLRNI